MVPILFHMFLTKQVKNPGRVKQKTKSIMYKKYKEYA